MQVPIRGQPLLDFARKDKVYNQLRVTDCLVSEDKPLIAGAHELLLIYRAFVHDKIKDGADWQKSLTWVSDMSSDVGIHEPAI